MKKFIALILLLSMAFTLCSCEKPDPYLSEYTQAQELFDAGNYYKAANIYEELKRCLYKDSAEKYKACYYAMGKEEMNKGYYGSAEGKFEECVDYLDAHDLLGYCFVQAEYKRLLSELEEVGLSKCDLTISSYEYEYYSPYSNYVQVVLESQNFKSLTNAQKISVFRRLHSWTSFQVDNSTIVSGGDEYKCELVGFSYLRMTKNGESPYEETIDAPRNPNANSGSSGSSRCPSCNGTGYVRYYSAGSDWESYLAGVEPYTTGKCTMCNGTGK